MEISYEHSQGILDTTKVLQANRIAVELSKYDGPMQQAFEIIELVRDGHEAGKSMEQIKQEDQRVNRNEFPFDWKSLLYRSRL